MSYLITCDQCRSTTEPQPREPGLADWYIVRKAPGAERHFCSLTCVSQWAGAQASEESK